MFVQADLADVDGIPAMLDRTVVRYGRLDCAFDNAGSSDGGPLNTSTAERCQPDWSVQRSSSFDREPAKNADKIALAKCLAMISCACLPSLSLTLFMSAAAAQTPSFPIVDGRQLQPTQQQIDSIEHGHARQRNVNLQSDIDRLYDEITRRASAPTGASPSSMELEPGEAR